jgi:hypothetical protein
MDSWDYHDRDGGLTMKGIRIKCYVEPQSRKYADGLEQVELYVYSEFVSSVTIPEKGQRMPITLLTPQGRFQGGLRDYRGRGQPYLCPDLISEKGGRKVSLARVLKDNGVSPGDTISFLGC